MYFIVHALDKPDAVERRMSALSAHREYLGWAPAAHGVKVLLSGPLSEDEGSPLKGSFFLLDADDRAAIERVFADDPLALADVWAKLDITAFQMRQNNMGKT